MEISFEQLLLCLLQDREDVIYINHEEDIFAKEAMILFDYEIESLSRRVLLLPAHKFDQIMANIAANL